MLLRDSARLARPRCVLLKSRDIDCQEATAPTRGLLLRQVYPSGNLLVFHTIGGHQHNAPVTPVAPALERAPAIRSRACLCAGFTAPAIRILCHPLKYGRAESSFTTHYTRSPSKEGQFTTEVWVTPDALQGLHRRRLTLWAIYLTVYRDLHSTQLVVGTFRN